VIDEYCAAVGKEMPAIPPQDLHAGEALVWFVDSGKAPMHVKTEPARSAHQRHKRKYAQGQLEEGSLFYFRGPENRLNLQVQNLSMFVQIAAGVDDGTWLYHLKNHEYSDWFRRAIKDPELGEAIEKIESNDGLSAAESREQIAEAIQSKYTASA
jgi:hypothetical protein